MTNLEKWISEAVQARNDEAVLRAFLKKSVPPLRRRVEKAMCSQDIRHLTGKLWLLDALRVEATTGGDVVHVGRMNGSTRTPVRVNIYFNSGAPCAVVDVYDEGDDVRVEGKWRNARYDEAAQIFALLLTDDCRACIRETS